MIFLNVLLALMGVYVSAYVGYNLILLFFHFMVKERKLPILPPKIKFGIIIPAHNEELLLPRLLRSIRDQDYPSNMVRAIVVADNCTDGTAAIGHASGAVVLERFSDQFLGKGYAIRYALENTHLDEYDAIFIVDADSVVAGDCLRHLDGMVQQGSAIIQCFNGVANSNESWFTRLMDVSRAVGNEVLEPAKTRIGLSSHLMGNGMCFARYILSKYGWDAFTVGEDWEYYAKIVSRGERVAFAKSVRVYHQESRALKQATPQRMRWSSGRMAVAFRYGFHIFLKGMVEGNAIKIDASLPLLFPNPSMAVNLNLLLLVASVLSLNLVIFYWLLAVFALQVFLFCIGIMYTTNRLKKILALFMAPVFLAWKMIIDLSSLLGFGRRKWVRTQREI